MLPWSLIASYALLGNLWEIYHIMLATHVRSDLPYLRRYARALTGAQKAGDAYVKATLEAIIAAPAEFKQMPSPRQALYRFFHTIWESSYLHLNDNVQQPKPLTPLSRQALLLSALEGFSVCEVAFITGCSSEIIDGLLAQALADIDGLESTSVLIIEDEPLISMELERIVTDAGHSIAGTAATHRDAIEAFQKQTPGLVFADIQLADGSSGIAAVQEILENINVPVIFITAYPERLLTGERVEPTFLITKPFNPDAVRAAVSQALFFEISSFDA